LAGTPEGVKEIKNFRPCLSWKNKSTRRKSITE